MDVMKSNNESVCGGIRIPLVTDTLRKRLILCREKVPLGGRVIMKIKNKNKNDTK